MSLSIIVAASDNDAIGKDNKLLWRLKKDMKFFKETTMGCPVIMGRKTFESLGRPLPGRLNVVVSRSRPSVPEGVLVYETIEEAIARAKAEGKREQFIIGGGEIYKSTISLVDSIYMTRVHANINEADTFFPPIEKDEFICDWSLFVPADEENEHPFSFQFFVRKNKQ